MCYLFFVVGLILGSAVQSYVVNKGHIGKLIISDPTERDERPYVFMELSKPLISFARRRIVVLKVDSSRFTQK